MSFSKISTMKTALMRECYILPVKNHEGRRLVSSGFKHVEHVRPNRGPRKRVSPQQNKICCNCVQIQIGLMTYDGCNLKVRGATVMVAVERNAIAAEILECAVDKHCACDCSLPRTTYRPVSYTHLTLPTKRIV